MLVNLILFGVIPAVLAELYFSQSGFNDVLREYIKTGAQTEFETCNIIVTDDESCDAQLHTYAMFSRCCKKIVNDLANTRYLSDSETTTTITLVGDLDRLESVSESLVNTSFFRNRGRFRFFICGQLEDDSRIVDSLRMIWKSRILKASLVYFYNSLRVASYDPFSEEIRNASALSPDHRKNEFFQNVKNLHGHKIEVAGYYNPVNTTDTTLDTVLYKTLNTVMNASLHFTMLDANESYTNVITALTSGNADICPLTKSMVLFSQYEDVVDFTFPHMMNDIVALVPKPSPISNSIGLAKVTYKMTILVTIALVAVEILYKNLRLHRRECSFSMGYFLFSMYGMPFVKFKNKSILIASLMIFNVIVSVMVTVQLLQDFIKPHWEPRIVNWEQLQKTKLDIYSPYLFDEINSTHEVSAPMLIFKLLLEEKLNRAFILSHYVANAVLLSIWNPHLEIMPEHIIPSVGVYVVRKNSPYLDTMNHAIALLKELGEKTLQPPATEKIADREVLTFENFWVIFLWLLIMYFICIVVLVIEFLINS